MDVSYWRKQTAATSLFPDLAWNRPERRDQAGKLGIVGGNKLGFVAVAESYQHAKDTGAGHVRVLLPDCLKNTVPRTLTDVVYAASNQSGSLSQDALGEMAALGAWADGILLIGDAGRSSETAITYEKWLTTYSGPLTVTRDAIDLIKNNPRLLVERQDTLVVASFAQVQTLFKNVYYPKMLTFNMQLMQLVEALHKFTITYPVTIMTLHKDTIIIASKGEVVTQQWDAPMAIWRGSTATNAACWWLWSPHQALEATTMSIANHS